jgi:hypothetical protein
MLAISGGENMLEAISLDAKTMIIKSDEETDFSEIINFIIQKDKNKDIASFLNFAAENRIVDKEFKFNRDECYDR